VQFYDENSVEAALLLDGKKFPPLLPRNLRVVRAKRNAGQKNTGGDGNRRDVRTKTPLGKQSNNNSLAGRAPRLFGRAGAAQLRNKEKMHGKSGGAHATGANAVGTGGGVGTGTHVVFEGFRATEDRGFKFKTKSRGAKARGGKPKTRSAKRAKAWKAKKTG
jgi:nucleolar protein 12